MNASGVSLELATTPEFFPLAQSTAEKAAQAMGLGEEEVRRLGMATEEIFLALCNTAADRRLVMRCLPGGCSVSIEFHFSARHFPMEYFNLTSSVSADNEADMGSMGLLIASRLVDRFSVDREEDGSLVLTLVKEKAYESPPGQAVAPLPPQESFTVRKADPEEAAHAAGQAAGIYPPAVMPRSFLRPRMLVDMLDFGQNRAAVAVGKGGDIAGVIVWDWTPGSKIVECHGPFVLSEDHSPAICEALLDFCIGDIAKLPVTGLVNRRPNQDLPVHYFEKVGSLPLTGADGHRVEVPAYFRQMHEDPGSTVWAHERLEPFLREQYLQLALPRKIIRPAGRSQDPLAKSVLFTKFDRSRGAATLWPVSPGPDIPQNLACHVAMLASEKVAGVFFSLDLGRPWQTGFAPALLDSGFTPRYILPYAGAGDLALFSL